MTPHTLQQIKNVAPFVIEVTIDDNPPECCYFQHIESAMGQETRLRNAQKTRRFGDVTFKRLRWLGS